ncbi:hypothetical protein KC726_03345 [Candidatus Woesebacteria bacterium]|nr:hypothetical protein [Candidatus Woesebacteria bacterium]
MDTVITQEQHEYQAFDTLQKYVTNMWMHPLVDEALIRHREKGKERVEELIKEMNLQGVPYVAFLVGSSLWSTNLPEEEESDYDTVFFFQPDKDNPREIAPKKHLTQLAIKQRERFYYYSIDAVSSSTMSDLSNLDALPVEDLNSLGLLLFVPDELVIGSKELAADLRVRLCQCNKEGYAPQQHLRETMLSWPTITKTLHTLPTKKRENRFIQKLKQRVERGKDDRKAHTKYRLRYINKFIENFEKMKQDIPSMAFIAQAMNASRGKLPLKTDFGSYTRVDLRSTLETG